mmetsp:Transcript_11872/g.32072  ORF Transcript_11872/g.32072 Transcript_11872/m.32072 type:complete len:346 (+) Transcript_11872:968-2005(+)
MLDVPITVFQIGIMTSITALFKGKKRQIVQEGGLELQSSNATTDEGAVERNNESENAESTEPGMVAKYAPFVVMLTYVCSFIFYIVSAFKALDAHQKFMFRVFVHPVIVVTGEAILRTDAAHVSSIPPQIKALNLIQFDMYFQLCGRLLMASGPEGELAGVLVVIVALQELLMRVTYLPKQRFVRRLLGLPPMSAEERARFLEVLSIDSVSSMQSEIAAILIAACFKILLYDQRLLFDFGFNPTGPPPVANREVALMLLALALEALSDCVAMAVQTKQGLRLKSLWAGHRRWEMALWLLLSQCLMCGLVLYTFAAKPTFLQCASADLCTCDFFTDTPIGSAWCNC